MNVYNTCGQSCADCDAHGNPEPCPHGCQSHPTCRQIPKIGDRVRITGLMPNDPWPIPVGTEGTVEEVRESVNQIYVEWDIPRKLILLCTDPFKILR